VSDCHPTDWRQNSAGYGQRSRRVDGKVTTVYHHRETWKAHHGAIPAGHEVDHACNNTSCRNIKHLQLVPAAQNKKLRWARRPAPPNCAQGHSNWIQRKNGGGRVCLTCAKTTYRRKSS
jgi:hypothetical protein